MDTFGDEGPACLPGSIGANSRASSVPCPEERPLHFALHLEGVGWHRQFSAGDFRLSFFNAVIYERPSAGACKDELSPCTGVGNSLGSGNCPRAPGCAPRPRCLPHLELLGGEVLCEPEIRLLSQGQMFDFITQYREL